MASTSTQDVLRIYWDGIHVGLTFNLWIVGILILVFLILATIRFWGNFSDLFSPEVQLSVPLGGLGSISIKADYSISQIAYTAWVELITRKAGLLIDPENDVVVEIYNSWYQIFGNMRELVKTIPASHLKKKNTKTLINLLIGTLNKGLRPHLTIWQAKFRRWYAFELTKEENHAKTPQQIQKNFPEYKELIDDLLHINKQMVEYTEQLKKLVKLETEH